jgi:predicted GNAT superfamily acetyltransferase
MLAVSPKAQGRGIGRALKYYQRDRCRAIGVETMYWTFDPFVARNAQLNLRRLGARVAEFVPDMYGADTNSPEHGSLGTDRLVAAWPVSTEPLPLPSGDDVLRSAPVVAGRRGDAPAPGAALPDAQAVALRVPADYHALLTSDIELAREWRMSARRAFLHYLPRGYQVSAFSAAGDDAAYLLTR